MSITSREIYNKMNKSQIFNSNNPKIESINNKPIKVELKNENISILQQKNNKYQPFINRKKKEEIKVIKRNHNESDIFFTKTLSSSMKQKLKEDAFPKKEEYDSNYKPENYVKYNYSSFDQKMHDLYNEKGDKFLSNKKKEKGKPKKVLVSSKGYNEYLEKYMNDNYSNYMLYKQTYNRNHKTMEEVLYNKENKYKPNSTSLENYNREFESNIFNVKNTNYSKFMNSHKVNKNFNKSVELRKSRNINVKGTLKWPAKINWTQNSEIFFKSGTKNESQNKSMTAFDRNQVDSVRGLIEGNDEKRIHNIKDNTINRKKNDLLKIEYKRPNFDKKDFTISRAQKLTNNYSVLEDEREYQNNIKINNMGNKYEIKEYNILKPGNIDILDFEKLLKNKGIHLIEIKEKKDILKNDNNAKNNRILQIKIRENIFEKKNTDKLKNIEKELKKNNKQIQIKQAQKKKNHRLISADFIYKKK